MQRTKYDHSYPLCRRSCGRFVTNLLHPSGIQRLASYKTDLPADLSRDEQAERHAFI